MGLPSLPVLSKREMNECIEFEMDKILFHISIRLLGILGVGRNFMNL